MWTGSCLCGGVRYEVTAEKLAPVGFCHCKQCQRASGSAFAVSTTVAKSELRLVSGEELLREFESSPGRFRVFCSRCGSPMFKRAQDQPDSVRIRLGTLDQDPGVRPLVHVWVGARAPWYTITDALPQLPEGLPPTPVRRTV
jgi:hypothetical protein